MARRKSARAEPGEPAASPLNPWLSIWIKPRKTIRQIVKTDPTRYVTILAALAGVSQVFTEASNEHVGDTATLAFIMATALIAGPFVGLISLHLGAAVVRWVAEQFKGRATTVELRAAIAWAAIPAIINLVILIVEISMFGVEIFSTATPQVEANVVLSTVLFVIDAVLAVWAVVLLVACLSAVSHVSTWVGLMLAIVPIFITSFIAARAVEAALLFG